jgi:hypothetical protein
MDLPSYARLRRNLPLNAAKPRPRRARLVGSGVTELVPQVAENAGMSLDDRRLRNRKSEIQDFQAPFGSEDQIPRLQVAVENSLFMRSFQACCQHAAQPQNFVFGQRPSANKSRTVLPLDVFEDNINNRARRPTRNRKPFR